MSQPITITPFNIGLPIGTILPVINKSAIPKGWLICDGNTIHAKYSDLIRMLGTSNTPNLTGRFLIGSGAEPRDENSDRSKANFNKSQDFEIRSYGGECETKLTKSHLPAHDHNITIQRFKFEAGTNSIASNNKFEVAKEYGREEYSKNYPQNYWEVGKNLPHNNMPPYFTVYYIIYTGLIE